METQTMHQGNFQKKEPFGFVPDQFGLFDQHFIYRLKTKQTYDKQVKKIHNVIFGWPKHF